MIRLFAGCGLAALVLGCLIAGPAYHPLNVAACAIACFPAVVLATLTILREE